MVVTLGSTWNGHAVAFCTSSTVTPGASSLSVMPLPPFLSTSNTHRSVMMRSTTARPVSGSVHAFLILAAPLAVCSMVTTTRHPLDTRSMAPPMPLTILPGITQLARSPLGATSSAPRIVRSMCPPRIIANDWSDEKMDDDGRYDTVCLPALMRSASTSFSSGNGPMPSRPFSDCSSMCIPGGRKLDASVGMPMPRFTYMPSWNSRAARRASFSRIGSAAGSFLPPAAPLASAASGLRVVRNSMRFSYLGGHTMRCT
mmetsp:Transcript_24335/g.75388  ORF Transcript_24335/g.75388 Transcript_24335/m.75388 type:complete len:257 (+) Transcript_24335:443-1213(+)